MKAPGLVPPCREEGGTRRVLGIGETVVIVVILVTALWLLTHGTPLPMATAAVTACGLSAATVVRLASDAGTPVTAARVVRAVVLDGRA